MQEFTIFRICSVLGVTPNVIMDIEDYEG